MKTQAALLVQTGSPLVVAEIEIPALKPGQVLVEITYSGACGTQVMEWRGDKGEDKWVPHCLGHEGTGVVLETGSAVTKVKPDDKVVLSWIKGSGIEAGGAVYEWDGKKVNAGGVTTFQRHAVVSENRLTLLPSHLPMDVAVLLGCAAPTGMGAVYNVLKVQPGDAIAVFGTGGIGLNALMAASLAGAMPVIGIDPNPTRRAFAKLYGATHVIDPTEADVLAEIRKIAPQGEGTTVAGPVDWANDPIILFSNNKPNAKELLEGLRGRLASIRRIDNVDYIAKGSASQPAPPAMINELTRKYRIGLFALGD